MSDFSIAGNTPERTYEEDTSVDTIHAPVTSQVSIESWHIDILVVIIGLLALAFFIAMGDVFALLGPWVIYMGVLSIRKRSGSGWKMLRIITGASLLCLSMAVLLLPGHTGPWYILGGVLGLLGGSGYLMPTLITLRQMR